MLCYVIYYILYIIINIYIYTYELLYDIPRFKKLCSCKPHDFYGNAAMPGQLDLSQGHVLSPALLPRPVEIFTLVSLS